MFKVGDRVRTTEKYMSNAIGTKGTITKVMEAEKDMYRVIFASQEGTSAIYGSRIERIEMNINSHMKFDVGDNKELSRAIQERLFDLGCTWGDCTNIIKFVDASSLFLTEKKITCGSFAETYSNNNGTVATLDTLYHLEAVHTITIDGKEVVLSEESFKALKQELCDG